jgi:ubiquinone/menaquinone biosynthesis C-methylase UbiE
MPTSSKEGKKEIVDWCRELANINFILDIGAGKGTYVNLLKKRKLFRETHWTGIEAWTPYVTQYKLDELYNTLIDSDVRKVNFDNLYFDLIFMGDVLEHMTKDEAILLVTVLSKISKYCVISIPIVHYPQDEIFNNPFEKHVKDDWSHDEVIASFPNIVKTFQGTEIGCYLLQFK